MDWSPEQHYAIDAVQAWLDGQGQQVFRLFGYAGTGKTTLARHLAADAGNAMFGAFTGKAALVLQQKGCGEARTIHSMIYLVAERSRQPLLKLQERLQELLESNAASGADLSRVRREIAAEESRMRSPCFSLNPDADVQGADLIVLDEVSMVGESMAEDILSFGIPVLALGDPAQLPPVADGGYFTNVDPDIMLTEIHRQAAGNPIIDLATQVRQGQSLQLGEYGESRVMAKGTLTRPELLEFDQILVGKNNSRRHVNRILREELGRQGHLPEPGDKLVCLRNDSNTGLLNGSLWIAQGCIPSPDGLRIDLTIQDPDTGSTMTVEAHAAPFEAYLAPNYEEGKIAPWDHKAAQSFDYGYALTVHKAQGSAWKNVLLVDQSYVFRQNANKWLYTGITRASEQVTVTM